MATRTFQRQKQQQSRVRLNVNVYTDMENKERAKQKKGDDFCRRKNMEIGGEKMRNASHQQGENKWQ